MREKDFTVELYNRIISGLKGIDPKLAEIVRQDLRASGQMGGFLDTVGSVFTTGLTSYRDVVIDKERAKIVEKQAKAMAEREARNIQLEIQRDMIRAQNDFRAREALAAQSYEVEGFLKTLSLSDNQKMALYVAGGLALYLLLSKVKA